MPASRSAEVRAHLSDWTLRVGLPLPARGDWQVADGWLACGLALLCGGATAVVLSVWTRVAPATLPIPDRLLPLSVILALSDGALAAAFTLRYVGAEILAWRWLTVAAAVLGAVWSDPAGSRARLWIPWLVTAALLGLAMRAGETAAAALAGVLHRLPRGNPLYGHGAKIDWSTARTAESAPADADLDRITGENPLWTTWRLVAEAWLLAAVCAAIGGAGPAYRVAAGCTALGGAVLVLGADVSVLRASWLARRFVVDTRHLRTHWGLGLAVALGLVAVALSVPLPGGIVPAVRGLGGVGLSSPVPRGTVMAHSGMPMPHVPQPAGVNVVALLGAVLHAIAIEILGSPFLLLAEIPIALPLLAAAAVVAILVLRFPRETRAVVRRLLASLVALLAFWRWIRLPARMRAALRRLGLGRPNPEEPPRPVASATLLERAWALLDPRAAVRATYRRFLREMAAAGLARPDHVSPRAFARTLPGVPDGVDDLTTAYELARYSDHSPERRWVEMARRGVAAVGRIIRRPHGRSRPRRR